MDNQLTIGKTAAGENSASREVLAGIPHVRLANMEIDNAAIQLVPERLIRSRKVLPLSYNNQAITVALAEPLNYQIIDDVRMATGLQVIPVYAQEEELNNTIAYLLAFRINPDIQSILGELQHGMKNVTSIVQESSSVTGDDDAPIIRMVNALLIQAVQVGCSDIHIEPQSDDVRIRFRVDGELYPVIALSKILLAALVSRIKIMAGLDIAEKRLPQDGRFRMAIEQREVDFRVSTLPIFYGEKVVIRVLDKAAALTAIDHLGFSVLNRIRMHSLAQRAQGLILVTGSTGSGKTTTLYALLSELNSPARNIITLEDPIEYSLPGINQVQINPKAGLTFADGLGSILRQDPDIIMVGEIRDRATAQLAVQAALTGHLVLSTLHTNSAAGTIARLAEMGIENYLLGTSLAGIVSQRLVRQLCEHCRRKYILNQDIARRLGINDEEGCQFYRPTGCNFCRQLGYKGRVALQEVMLAGRQVRAMINRGAHADEIQTAAIREGMITCRNDGLTKAREGLTSLEEVVKAASEEE